jgi:hypothetical protein
VQDISIVVQGVCPPASEVPQDSEIREFIKTITAVSIVNSAKLVIEYVLCKVSIVDNSL